MVLAERRRRGARSRWYCLLGLTIAAVLAARKAEATQGESGDPLRSALIAGGAQYGSWAFSRFSPSSWTQDTCRLCGSNRLDLEVRNRLVWEHPRAAAATSDALVLSIRVASVGASFLIGQETSLRQGVTDGLVVVEAMFLASFGTRLIKVAAARRRPYGFYYEGLYPSSHNKNHSFWSGHTADAFSAMSALATVAYHHEWPGFPWIAAGGILAATSVGYLRIGADKHWLSDVLAGGAFGTAVGVTVPLLELGPPKHGVQLTTTIMPFGIAGIF